MCGICGKVMMERERRVDASLVPKMMASLRHRGPDGNGSYVRGNVGLGHTRLSIIDLVTGEQPLWNEDGRVVVVFNGEIYNFKELRHQLETHGHVFRTTSDTEVIVHAYEQYGDACVEKLRGMFAFALWDVARQRLLLARDRVGIKPLYYAQTHDGVVFGSEIKALLADPAVSRDVDVNGVPLFLALKYMPGYKTLLRSVKRLLPGHYMTVENGQIATTRYWDLEFNELRADQGIDAATDELKALLAETVRDHLISDVPVGVLLSGGVDSAGMLALASAASADPLHTFTIGFDRPGFVDERRDAGEIARRYGTRHFETTISPEQFAGFLPDYVWHMEEPVCEPPAVALYYVSKLAAQHVKVLLSGEGGDEAFAGYSNYRATLWLERFKQSIPAVGVAASGWVLGQLASATADSGLTTVASGLTVPLAHRYFSRRATAQVAAGALPFSDEFVNRVGRPDVIAEFEPLFNRVSGLDPLSKMLYVDTKTWLPDDLLIKADKITMANSVELRVPLLDHRVLEFAASLPTNFKVRGFSTKFILKQSLRDLVPARILDKKKTGFPVPYASWLQNELGDYVKDVLTDSRTLSRGYFDRAGVERTLARVNGGASSADLFSLVVLELWHRAFADSAVAA